MINKLNKSKPKKLLIVLFIAVFALFLTSCTAQTPPRSAIADYDYSEMRLSQLDIIAGQIDVERPIVVITTTFGVIRVALFPEYAPNTVANFIARVEEGFYDDSAILAIQDEAFFQAGVNSDGIAHEIEIENEYSPNMWPFRGALGGYGTTQGISDSRFFIVDELTLTYSERERLGEMLVDGENTLPDKLLEAFDEIGGAIPLSGIFTIFGQVIDVQSLEVVSKIVATDVDRLSRPREEIKIITIELESS
ncbi:MAG: peptidylprolyl isomerase [Oscillospiraceae bacterium]|nr:peptidylprolyl isomerase [Oscillospiraceae bacterium]